MAQSPPPFTWQKAPAGTQLPAGDVHLWLAQCDLPPEEVARLGQWLATDEKERANRFYFEQDRQRYIAGRGRLRQLLGQYLGMEPGRITFDYGPHGKPYLPNTPLRFNLAHSHQLALLAFSWGRELGVDLEYIRPLPDAHQLVSRFFAPNEIQAWRQGTPAGQQAAFFAIWTAKEAYLKATGQGLAIPLDSFEVSLEQGGTLYTPHQPTRWSLFPLPAPPTYAAALVAERGEGQIVHYQF